MSTVIVYESMFGNTRRVAEAIADGLRRMEPVEVVRIADAAPATAWADVVILGAPTHAWSLSRPATRASAADTADTPRSTVRLEPAAQRMGLREWLDGNIELPRVGVTFDTRVHGLGGAFGHASRALDRRLRRHGVQVRDSRSFFVDRKNELLPGELDRAVAWGAELAGLLSTDRR